MALTPDQRGVAWPRNLLKGPLTEPTLNNREQNRTSQGKRQGYNGIRGESEDENRHAKRHDGSA